MRIFQIGLVLAALAEAVLGITCLYKYQIGIQSQIDDLAYQLNPDVPELMKNVSDSFSDTPIYY